MGFSEWVRQLFGGRLRMNGERWDARSAAGYFVSTAYQSDFVNNAIDRVASEISKIDVKSVIERADSTIVQNDDLTRLFRFGPNPLQTTKDFLASIEWVRRKHGNVFIFPVYDIIRDAYQNETRRYRAFYVLQPVDFEVGVSVRGDVWEICFLYADGKQYTLAYSDLIHLKWRRGANLFKGGGDDSGNMPTKDLLQSVNALNATVDGLPKAIAASMQVKGIYHAKSLMDSSRQNEQRVNLEDHILTSKMGVVMTDIAGEFTPVNMQAPIVSAPTMKFMKSGIIQRYGVNEAVLDGDYTGSQHSSFYQTTIEDFIVDAEQAFSRACFTQREQDIGHRLKFYYSRIKYLSTADQLEMARLARDTGLLTQNQVLEMFGLPPFEGGDIRLRSLNYVNADIADQYQMGKANASATPSSGQAEQVNSGPGTTEQGTKGTASGMQDLAKETNDGKEGKDESEN